MIHQIALIKYVLRVFASTVIKITGQLVLPSCQGPKSDLLKDRFWYRLCEF